MKQRYPSFLIIVFLLAPKLYFELVLYYGKQNNSQTQKIVSMTQNKVRRKNALCMLLASTTQSNPVSGAKDTALRHFSDITHGGKFEGSHRLYIALCNNKQLSKLPMKKN